MTHLSCLSKRFLSLEAASSNTPPPLLPDRGTCPSCETSVRWGDVIRGCYRRKIHTEDNGTTRLKNQRRLAKLAKLKAIVNGDVEPIPEGIDSASEDKVKKPARKGRPPKIGGANDTTTSKKPRTGRAKKSDLVVGAAKSSDKTEVVPEKKIATRSKKPTFLDADLDDLDAESEVSERFDFNTDEENDDVDKDIDASDGEKEAAYFAAAEGSREMKANDLEESGSSSSTLPSPRIVASPSKKRRTLDFSGIHEEEDRVAASSSTRQVSLSLPLQSGSTTGYRQILEISDSD